MSEHAPDPPTDAAESASASRRRLLDDERGEAFPSDRRTGSAVDTQLSVFKALANEKRIRILEALREGELCACELEAVLDAPQSTVASHLSSLREAGLVHTRDSGKWTYYRIADTASLQLLELAEALGKDA